jgi:hypothetical protein
MFTQVGTMVGGIVHTKGSTAVSMLFWSTSTFPSLVDLQQRAIRCLAVVWTMSLPCSPTLRLLAEKDDQGSFFVLLCSKEKIYVACIDFKLPELLP